MTIQLQFSVQTLSFIFVFMFISTQEKPLDKDAELPQVIISLRYSSKIYCNSLKMTVGGGPHFSRVFPLVGHVHNVEILFVSRKRRLKKRALM